jgi:hypothetical protein
MTAIFVLEESVNASPITCSGELWNISKDDSGETWIEIGHGIYQCSVRDVASQAGKKILSVCKLKSRCTVKVDLAPRTAEEMAEQDDVVVSDKDEVRWVRSGAADDTGEAGDAVEDPVR